MKVTQKGQVTIPLEIRKKFGIDESTEVDFVERNGQIIVEKAKGANRNQSKIRSLRGVSNSKNGMKMSTEQIMALTR